MTTPRLAILAVAVAALAAGCGESCPTGTADVENIPSSCSLAANQTVTLYVNLCPHCNETSPQCEVDTSGAASGEIFLNTFWELCEEDQDCPAGGCDVSGVPCTFQVPPGEYTVITANGPSSSITVGAGGSPTCGNPGALAASF
ncbi:MAG TPA: hypothetical protein VD838_10280 [Anaeromyxobacteraceae bacterium]|nr:hypothetical protein [Anaeromyxobacteraceae bacterium]